LSFYSALKENQRNLFLKIILLKIELEKSTVFLVVFLHRMY